ncbi:hypothetical protein HY638_05415 [Candidatus Woesearchaeota archaeon]|nr:hypothetical protein [Candidatus Woesearchaeota archaeon]
MEKVPYIGEPRHGSGLKKCLIVLGGVAVIAASTLAYHDVRKGYDASKQDGSVIVKEIHELREKSLDERVKSTLEDLSGHPEDMSRNYPLLADAVEAGLAGRQDYAERLARSSLSSLDGKTVAQETYDAISKSVEQRLGESPETANKLIAESLAALKHGENKVDKDAYMAMFGVIMERAEENPELMDFFGENAVNYMEKKFQEKYLGKLGIKLREGAEKLKERGKEALDALTKPREEK